MDVCNSYNFFCCCTMLVVIQTKSQKYALLLPLLHCPGYVFQTNSLCISLSCLRLFPSFRYMASCKSTGSTTGTGCFFLMHGNKECRRILPLKHPKFEVSDNSCRHLFRRYHRISYELYPLSYGTFFKFRWDSNPRQHSATK